ncbi:ArsR family transcriptional regulator [Paenibacillus sp. LMG 31456]|uniref:ArsR family transcriptional regulator n=1 Tax=Paenibacillus foliorum TaxID=2654974 RepID=A0A972GQ86_9BACL|nr:ArsR family transcriptional regulator [Paenibacillus foliorum]NOU94797.1 ArsR family transcriptional regulator [Paenibacillus foliorum]
MKIRLGYIGVEDTMEMVLAVIRKYPDYECYPYTHTRFEEIDDLLEQHSGEVDLWLFSGPLPYEAAQQSGKTSKPLFFIPYTGTSLYRTLCEILYQQKLLINELSFDILSQAELQQIFSEFSIKDCPIYNKEYSGSDDDLVEYHLKLWREGKTKAAVTCVWIVQQKLASLGVPVFRVRPTESSIEAVLNTALRAHETLQFMDAQVAVQIIKTDPYNGVSQELFSSDELFNMEMALTQKLLQYAKKVQGSLKHAGTGRFAIFTTRGIVRELTSNFTTIPDFAELKQLESQLTNCGIGIGRTVYEAELLAGKALLHTRSYKDGAWMVFFEDKTITGPLGKPEQLSYSYVSDDLQKISAASSLSIATLGKIQFILRKRATDEINAYELAQHMQILPRSARRILIQLEASGLAQIIGEDNPHPRGRPRKIYRITLNLE